MKAWITITAAAALLSGCENGNESPKRSPGEALSAQSTDKVKDPVCGMLIDKSSAKANEDYKDVRYYFCSDDCHSKFKATPGKYAR